MDNGLNPIAAAVIDRSFQTYLTLLDALNERDFLEQVQAFEDMRAADDPGKWAFVRTGLTASLATRPQTSITDTVAVKLQYTGSRNLAEFVPETEEDTVKFLMREDADTSEDIFDLKPNMPLLGELRRINRCLDIQGGLELLDQINPI